MPWCRAVERDGVWRFAAITDGEPEPIGFCREDRGHSTREEASRCYRRHLLTWALERNVLVPAPFACAVCGAATVWIATVDHWHTPLCHMHQHRTFVERLYPTVTELWTPEIVQGPSRAA